MALVLPTDCLLNPLNICRVDFDNVFCGGGWDVSREFVEEDKASRYGLGVDPCISKTQGNIGNHLQSHHISSHYCELHALVQSDCFIVSAICYRSNISLETIFPLLNCATHRIWRTDSKSVAFLLFLDFAFPSHLKPT